MLVRLFRLALAVCGPLAIGYLIWQFMTGQASMAPGGPAQVVNIQVSPVIIEEIRQVKKLILVEQFSSVDITYNEAPTSWGGFLEKLGVRQEFVVILRGKVSAGFDLSQLTEDDIWVSADGKRVQLTLPPPQIFTEDTVIDNERTHVFAKTDLCPDFLCATSLEAYITEITPEGRKRLIAAAQENDILRQAAVEGKLYYEKLLNQLGIAEVRVVVQGYDL